MIYAGGMKFILLSAILFAPGTVLYFIARREQGQPVFDKASDWITFGVIVGCCRLRRLRSGHRRHFHLTTNQEHIMATAKGKAKAKSAKDEVKFGVHSEVGQLRKVMVCAPGRGAQRLTPSNCDELLFDDVLWVQNARRDHFDFVAKMRDRGVEVVELHDLLAEIVANARSASTGCWTAR